MTHSLTGIEIMVTRALKGGELCQLIERAGGKVWDFPTVLFDEVPDQDSLYQALHVLHAYDWLIFMSPQAVYYWQAAMKAQKLSCPTHLQFAAVGQSTALALQNAIHAPVLYPESDWRSEGLLAMPAFQSPLNTKIAIVRGLGGRHLLDQVLNKRGAQVSSILVYRRILPTVDVKPYLDLLKEHRIHVIVSLSFESIYHLQLLLGPAQKTCLNKIPHVVPSERIKRLAQDLGLETIWVARNVSSEAILEVLITKGMHHD